jgi:transposase InsO family protein
MLLPVSTDRALVPLWINNQIYGALVDTGASCSFIHPRLSSLGSPIRVPPLNVRLGVAHHSYIASQAVKIVFRLGILSSSWIFYGLPDAAVDVILGLDFLKQFHLKPDPIKNRLEFPAGDTLSFLPEPRRTPLHKQPILAPLDVDLTGSGLDIDRKQMFLKILNSKYFATEEVPYGRMVGVQHAIDSGSSRPIYQNCRPTSPLEREIVRDEIKMMLEQGIIRPSQSPWSSPVVLVKKKDGATRFCVDYRKLNDVTVKDRHPLPRIQEYLEALRGARYFTTLDAASGYWQIPMDEESIPKTAFACSEGFFEFNVMPFGLCNAPATFQRAMNSVLAGLTWKCCLVYMDDILVFSRDFDDHVRAVKLVMDRLLDQGLLLKFKKCSFLKKSILFLGHIVKAEGIQPDPSKVSRLREFPKPTNPTEVRAFLGLAGYYRKFVRNFGTLAAPLYELTEKKGFVWTVEAQKSYDVLRSTLSESAILHHPDFCHPFILDTDASEIGMGIVLSQKDDQENERIIAMDSRKFTSAELKWHIREKEALAIIFGLEKFRHFLLGAKFIVRSDHKSLEWLFHAKTGRLARWAIRIGEFLPFQIYHRAGKNHSNVDALTRAFAESESFPDSAFCNSLLPEKFSLPSDKEIRAAQAEDPEIVKSKLKELLISRKGILGLSDNGRWRPFLPKILAIQVLRHLHQHPLGGHQGPQRMRSLIAKYFATNLSVGEIRGLLGKCLDCQRRKPPLPLHGLLKSSVPEAPWRTVAMDFAGPYPSSRDGFRYVLVFVDQFTKWVELVPTHDQTAISVIRAFYHNVLCRHGCPQRLLSDNGPSFRSSLVDALCTHFGIKKIFTTAYYPQGDGYAERFMRTMNNSLAALTTHSVDDWSDYLPGIAFGYNSADHAATGTSPFELNTGRVPFLSGGSEFGHEGLSISQTRYVRRLRNIISQANNRARRNMNVYFESMKRRFDRARKDIKMKIGKLALVRLSDYERGKEQSRKLAPRWSLPVQIIERSPDDSNYVVRYLDGREERINIHRLLPIEEDYWERNKNAEVTEDMEKCGARVDGGEQYAPYEPAEDLQLKIHSSGGDSTSSDPHPCGASTLPSQESSSGPIVDISAPSDNSV